MQLQFSLLMYGAVGLGIAIAVILGLIMMAPGAPTFIMAKISGGRVLLDFLRDGTWQIKRYKFRRGFAFNKDGIHQIIPHAMAHNKGVSLGACWSETGTAIPIEQAAAMGMLSRIGIMDAETLELFNFFLKDPDQFNTLMTDPAKNTFELFPSSDATSGTFGAMLEHVKESYAITEDDMVLALFQRIRETIPYIDTAEKARKFRALRYPYWYNKTKGLVCNVMGVMLPWTEIKNFQIYHQHPAAFADIVDDESNRKARKIGKDKTMLIIIAAIAIIGVVGGMALLFKMLGFV